MFWCHCHCCSGDLSSPVQLFLLQHCSAGVQLCATEHFDSSQPLGIGLLLQGASGKGTFPKYTEIKTTQSLLCSEEEEGSR